MEPQGCCLRLVTFGRIKLARGWSSIGTHWAVQIRPMLKLGLSDQILFDSVGL